MPNQLKFQLAWYEDQYPINTIISQLSQKSRHLPKQPYPHLPDRWQRQIHAPDEPGPSGDALLQFRFAAAFTSLDGQAEHVAGE
ncbi:hypothetical protein BBD39_07725 [Arsenophonus endosymbiont of Bemisia tabaci Asia II 3]|nr:hypothetical protein BBD39_07725 [Arsenophonus endosymbiont of Bemisia tabaci Asia II 3]